MAKSQIPWDQIRTLWTQGQSGYDISRTFGGKPTRQAISKRARQKGWSREVDGIVSEKHLRKHAVTLGKDTPETRERIIELLSKGATLKLAAAANGISNDTLLRWRKDDIDFAAQCNAARNTMLADCAEAIYSQRNKDWKAAKHVLETAPETRNDYRTDPKGGKLEIIININRDDDGRDDVTVGTEFEGEAVEIEEGVAA